MSAPVLVGPPDSAITSLKARSDRRSAPAHDVLALLPVLALLHEAIDRRLDLTIRYGELQGLMAVSQFGTGKVFVQHDLTDREVRWSLAHELLHHLHGDPGDRHHDLEESRIEAAVAATMLDVAASLALQVHAERTGRDVDEVDTNRGRARLIRAVERHLAGGEDR